MEKSRDKKLSQFYSLSKETDIVLDVGVSNNEHNQQVNFFLKKFRYKANQYTGLAVEPMSQIRKLYPDKKIVEYDGKLFPFKDKQFDWVFSNAVVEHVGDQKKQLNFINEMLRVGKNVFFTTPNKYFPVESHSNTFFRHWNNQGFYKWCKKNNLSWNKEKLVLLSNNDLINIMDLTKAEYKIYSNRLLLYPMTYTVICSQKYSLKNQAGKATY